MDARGRLLRSSGRVFQILVVLLRYDLWKVKVLHFVGRKRRALGLLVDRVKREGTSGLGRISGPGIHVQVCQ